MFGKLWVEGDAHPLLFSAPSNESRLTWMGHLEQAIGMQPVSPAILHAEMRRETQGTGIGLSIVQHIIAAHGGKVTVTADPNTFTLTAPIQLPAES